MRKFILMMAMMFATVFSANAQIATENAKLFDNTYITINAGVAMPLNFDNTTPLNPSAGIAFGKWFSPVWGAELEGTLWGFESNGGGFNVPQNEDLNFGFIRGHYVGVNGLINLSNLFAGYRGAPRLFEVNTVVGMGWTHRYLKGDGNDINGLGFKTGLDFAFNIGKTKAHTLSIRPAVVWNVTPVVNGARELRLSSDYAQLYVGLAYTYRFKTSNKTHNFKTYDVGAMNSEIAYLNEENGRLSVELDSAKEAASRIPDTVVVEKVVTDTAYVDNTYVVNFAFDSYDFDNAACETMDKVTGVVDIYGYSSPEGDSKYNKKLSKKRANAVADYLRKRNVEVRNIIGDGSSSHTSNRIVIIKNVQE